MIEVIIRKLPSGVRGKKRLVYWTGSRWSTNRTSAMAVEPGNRFAAMEFAKVNTMGQRNKPEFYMLGNVNGAA